MTLHRVMLSGVTTLTFALAGCGSGTPGAMQPVPGSAHTRSPRPSSSSEDLIYAASADPAHKGSVYVFDYPTGKAVAQFVVPDHAQTLALCADTSGNVYAANDKGAVYVYAHDGAYPYATLRIDPPLKPVGCARGPGGNLVVALTGASYGEFAVFANASGSAAYVTSPDWTGLQGMTIDGASDLFYINNGELFETAELSQNGKRTRISFSGPFEPLWIQWDGNHLAAATYPNPPKHSGYEVQRFSIEGSPPHADLRGVTQFYDTREAQDTASFCIYGNSIMFPIPDHQTGRHRFGRFAFPNGGRPLTLVPGYAVSDLAVSAPPTR